MRAVPAFPGSLPALQGTPLLAGAERAPAPLVGSLFPPCPLGLQPLPFPGLRECFSDSEGFFLHSLLVLPPSCDSLLEEGTWGVGAGVGWCPPSKLPCWDLTVRRPAQRPVCVPSVAL